MNYRIYLETDLNRVFTKSLAPVAGFDHQVDRTIARDVVLARRARPTAD